MLRKILPYTSILVAVAAIYAGWTLWSRHADAERAVQEAKDAEAARDAEITRRYGGDRVRILSFYASPGKVAPGERALVCYSVSNAKAVKIEPFIEDVKPSLSKCLEVHPKAATTYKLTASGGPGQEETSSLTVEVRR
jgi:hypothetical protein